VYKVETPVASPSENFVSYKPAAAGRLQEYGTRD
jgi:hypothetical protein